MDTAKQLILTLKENNRSHVGYGLQKECEALVGHILQNMTKSDLPSLERDEKNEDDCLRYREEGNQQFVMGYEDEAIESYTRSLAYAVNEEMMAYAHANRSAALYKKKMFRECLIDLDAALSLGYPAEKRKKLLERGRKALAEIKKSLYIVEKDPTAIDEADQINVIINTDPSFNRKETNDLYDIEKKTHESTNDEYICFKQGIDSSKDSKKPRYLEDEGVLKLANGPSKEAPAASEGMKIVFSEEYGRHFVATMRFNPGDIVTIEDPYAHVIYEERFYTHCHHCLARSYNLIPCTKCPIAQYCSEKCRDLAWKVAHELECPIWSLLTNLLNIDKDKIRILTKIIRLLIVITEKGKRIDELRKDMAIAESNSDNRTAGFTDEGIFDSFSARCALSLATNMTTRPLIGISAFACISALASVLLATQTNFFGTQFQMSQLSINDQANFRFCGSIMFRACVIMSSNCFSVQQEPGIKSGSGLYITHSLYNHSCAPNTFRHFEGLTMVTRALQTISPGEQIFTSYGAGYAYMSRSERRKKIMEDYFFNCQCHACKNNWPTYNDILKKHIGSISKNKPLVEQLKPFKKRLLKNMYDIDAVKNVLTILYDETTQPCEEIVHAEQYLKSYYLDP
ncbi:SET and MYND domain-containing protein 4-like isoform X2 [Prorops nasuta]|uniref:SET and MYND domain-containing protein 4-like isoform X2 n=1 Tax=Prorops nasuta TaxID=863751 RepID=UPI0034CFCF06